MHSLCYHTLYHYNLFSRARADLVVNRLELHNLSRTDLDSVLDCVADNNNLSVSVSTSVTLDMLLPPLSVRLLRTDRPLSAEKLHRAQCQIVGARPKPRITWWRGINRINSTEQVKGSTVKL